MKLDADEKETLKSVEWGGWRSSRGHGSQSNSDTSSSEVNSVTRRGLMNSFSRPALTSCSTEIAHSFLRYSEPA